MEVPKLFSCQHINYNLMFWLNLLDLALLQPVHIDVNSIWTSLLAVAPSFLGKKCRTLVHHSRVAELHSCGMWWV